MKIIPKKEYIKLIILVIIFIGLVIGTTYAFLSLSDSKNNVTGQAGCFDIDYSGDVIKNTNLSVTTNYLEGASTTIRVKKSNTCKIYSKIGLYVYIDPNNTNISLLSGDLNYIVLDSSNNEIGSGVITSTGNTLLKVVPLTDIETLYKVYFWVNPSNNRTYDHTNISGYTYGETIQSSTIGGDESDIDNVITAINSKASSMNNGVYYFNDSGNLDYGNNTSVKLDLGNNIPKGVVSIWNKKLIYACLNYENNNYEYDLKTNNLNTRSMPCITDRYQNLVINGDLSYNSNYNLTDFGDYNSGGYLTKTSSDSDTLEMTDYIPVDSNKKYVVSADMKSSNTTATYYMGFKEYDESKNSISASHVMYMSNTLTTLSQELKKGDTVVHLTSLANWNVNTSTRTYQRGFIFWNYQDATGYSYPASTYSRKKSSNLYTDANVNKTANTITLTSAWTGGTYPSGTKVSQSNSGSAYNYSVLYNDKITTAFASYASPNITGTNTTASVVTNKFRAGTKFVRFAITDNYNSTANTTTDIRNISIREVQ